MVSHAKKSKKMSLAIKFMIGILCILIFVSGIQGFIAYNQLKTVLDKQMVDTISQQMSKVENTLEKNNETYNKIKDYHKSYLATLVKTVSEMVNMNPNELSSNEKLKELSEIMNVEALEITDEKGVVIYSAFEGDIGFDLSVTPSAKAIMPALKDKDFVLVRDPILKGGKVLIQFATSARKDKPGIIQIMVKPKILKELTKNVDIKNILKDVVVGKNGQAFTFNKEGKIIHHKEESMIGKQIEELGLSNTILEKDKGDLRYIFNGENMYSQYKNMGDYYLGLTVPKADFFDPLGNMVRNLLISIFIIVIVSFGLTYLIVNKVIIAKISIFVDTIGKIAKGKLNVTCDIKTNDEFNTLANGINEATKKLRHMINIIKNSSEGVSLHAEQLAFSAKETSQSISEVASSIQVVANNSNEQNRYSGNMNQKTKNIHNDMEGISESIKVVKEFTLKTSELAYDGNKYVNEVIHQMNDINKQVGESSYTINELNEKSKKIEEIVSLITGISDQTNLLALNAAIEAARAGEHGKGFAVVADEVRKLAEQSSKASGDINSLIQEIQEGIKKSVDVMNSSTEYSKAGIQIAEQTKLSFDNISTSIDDVNKRTEDVYLSMMNILKEIKEMKDIVESVNEITFSNDENAQSVSASTEEQSAMIEQVTSATEELAAMASELKNEVSTFDI